MIAPTSACASSSSASRRSGSRAGCSGRASSCGAPRGRPGVRRPGRLTGRPPRCPNGQPIVPADLAACTLPAGGRAWLPGCGVATTHTPHEREQPRPAQRTGRAPASQAAGPQSAPQVGELLALQALAGNQAVEAWLSDRVVARVPDPPPADGGAGGAAAQALGLVVEDAADPAPHRSGGTSSPPRCGPRSPAPCPRPPPGPRGRPPPTPSWTLSSRRTPGWTRPASSRR